MAIAKLLVFCLLQAALSGFCDACRNVTVPDDFVPDEKVGDWHVIARERYIGHILVCPQVTYTTLFDATYKATLQVRLVSDLGTVTTYTKETRSVGDPSHGTFETVSQDLNQNGALTQVLSFDKDKYMLLYECDRSSGNERLYLLSRRAKLHRRTLIRWQTFLSESGLGDLKLIPTVHENCWVFE